MSASDPLARVLAVARDLVVDVTSWSRELMEARGSGSNTWLRDPENGLWLYKATRTARATGVLQGEDWAEKAVERLAALIGTPLPRSSSRPSTGVMSSSGVSSPRTSRVVASSCREARRC